MRADVMTPRDLAKRQAARRLSNPEGGYRRETFTLPREEARATARGLFERFPKAAYMTEIEFWEELADGRIRFILRRLPAAD